MSTFQALSIMFFIWDVYTCFVDVYRQKEIDHPLSQAFVL